MYSTRLVIFLLFAVSAFAYIPCGRNFCNDADGCCNDVVLGPTCYNTNRSSCLSTSLPSSSDANVVGNRLCGPNDATCNTTCYDPTGYFCCNLNTLKQKGQSCDSAPATSAPTLAPTSAPAPKNNCPGAANTAGVNCSDASLCCGAGTMTPTCLPADGSKKCCTWYLSSTQCNPTQVCGGNLGYGASSQATCGPTGTTFCNQGDGINAFCGADEACCGNFGQYAFCCPKSNSTCPTNSAFTCAYTSAATTSAPTQAATTQAPTTTAPIKNNCPGAAGTAGVNCSDASLCCGAGTMTPTCLPADGSKKCCTWYLSSTQCNPTQVCGGNLGYGASSQATCGPTGTTFCNQGDGINAFCGADEACCGNYGQYAFCCPKSNSTCPTNSAFTCAYTSAATTSAPTQQRSTQAPTQAATKASTQAPTSQTTTAPIRNNCPGAAGTAGVNCSDASLCCGANTMFPSCLPADGSKKCCTWYLAATQCAPTQVCGGNLGYGASSSATCGPSGTVACTKGNGINTFCQPNDLCCGNYGSFAFCCPGNNSTCPTNGGYQCVYATK